MIKNRVNKIDNIGIFGNLYSVLLYLLLKDKTSISKTLFLVEKDLKNLNVKYKKIFFKNAKIKIFILLQRITILLKCFYLEKKYRLVGKRVYGNDHIPIAFYFLRKYDFYVIEEGLANYEKLEKVKERPKLYYFSKLGRTKQVKKVYLTGISGIPLEIKKKVEIIDIKKLWNKKTENEKENILKIFNLDKLNLSQKESRYILLTQPLSEDGYITEREKIKLYKKIIEKYPSRKIIIKKHPREKTKYEKVFQDITILSDTFPAEIFTLLGIEFEKVITLFSTSVFNFNFKNIDFYGTEVHPNLLKKFGSMDHIMKRNKFL